MTMPIVKLLKGLSLATVVLAVPTFAVFGLMANGSNRSSSVELSAEHDPLRNGFSVIGQKPVQRQNAAVSSNDPSETFDLRNWTFVGKPVPSSTLPPP